MGMKSSAKLLLANFYSSDLRHTTAAPSSIKNGFRDLDIHLLIYWFKYSTL